MTTVLYITANPMNEVTSYSIAIGQSFIDTYKETHPTDEVIHLDLFQEFIPQIDAEVFSGWSKLAAGTAFDQLTEMEQKKSLV